MPRPINKLKSRNFYDIGNQRETNELFRKKDWLLRAGINNDDNPVSENPVPSGRHNITTHNFRTATPPSVDDSRGVITVLTSASSAPAAQDDAIHGSSIHTVKPDGNVLDFYWESTGSHGTSSLSPSSSPKPDSRLEPLSESLRELPVLSLITREEFARKPSVLHGLFEAEASSDSIGYHADHVNVFFQDPKMEKPTLGYPLADGLSWCIHVSSYDQLQTIRSLLTQRVSVVSLQLEQTNNRDAAACLLAFNPSKHMFGQELKKVFLKALDCFESRRSFRLEVNLNRCVRSWCRSVLKMPCQVRGARLMVTNGQPPTPCYRPTSLPFCVACLPVWAVQRLAYRIKRRSQYEDFTLCFSAQDITLCAMSPELHGTSATDESESRKTRKGRDKGIQRSLGWTRIRKNRKAVTIATQTVTWEEERLDTLVVDLETDQGQDGSHWCVTSQRPTSRSRDARSDQPDSGFSSASSTERKMNSSTVGHCRKSRPPTGAFDFKSTCWTADQAAEVSLTHGSADRDHNTPRRDIRTTMLPRARADDVQDERTTLNSHRNRKVDFYTVTLRPDSCGQDSVTSEEEVEKEASRVPETQARRRRPQTPFPRLPQSRAKQAAPDIGTRECDTAHRQDPSHDVLYQNHLKTDAAKTPATKGRVPEVSRVCFTHPLPQRRGSSPSEDSSPCSEDKDERPNSREIDNVTGGPSHHPPLHFKNIKSVDKVKYKPVTKWKEKRPEPKAFPYTADLADFSEEEAIRGDDSDASEPSRRQDGSEKDKSLAVLFTPRHTLRQDRLHSPLRKLRCENDIEVVNDLEDLEFDEPMSKVKDAALPEDKTSAKSWPERPAAVRSVRDSATARLVAGQDLEIIDYENEGDDGQNFKEPPNPPTTEGMGEQRLMHTGYRPGPTNRLASVTNYPGPGRKNTSRRRYIALNSFRRKSNQRVLNADLRKQTRPGSRAHALVG